MKYLCAFLAVFLVCNSNTYTAAETATEIAAEIASDRGGDLEIYKNQNWEYSGFVEIELYNSNQDMPICFADGYYQTINSYPSGTEFRYRLYIENPVYIYAFAGDSGNAETTRIFPPEGQNHSLFTYNESGVSFPGEFTWIRLDESTGTDYLVTLFAKETLDIDKIRKRFEKANGSFTERVAAAVGSNFIPVEAQYETDEMRFFYRSKNLNNILCLLLAIKHNER